MDDKVIAGSVEKVEEGGGKEHRDGDVGNGWIEGNGGGGGGGGGRGGVSTPPTGGGGGETLSGMRRNF